MSNIIKKINRFVTHRTSIFVIIPFVLVAMFSLSYSNTNAQSTAEENINSESFKLMFCDGPEKLRHINDQGVYDSSYSRPGFVACDFQGFMGQAQRLINVMTILGVMAGIIGFSYAGYLYITGVPGNITRAYEIFKKVGIGLLLILSAWAIVYQLLSWLTDNKTFTGLLN